MYQRMLLSIGIYIGMAGELLASASCPVVLQSVHIRKAANSELYDQCFLAERDFLPECFATRLFDCNWLDQLRKSGKVRTVNGEDFIRSSDITAADFGQLRNYSLVAKLSSKRPKMTDIKQVDQDLFAANFRLDLLDNLTAELRPLKKAIVQKQKDQVTLWIQVIEEKIIPQLMQRVDRFPYMDEQKKADLKNNIGMAARSDLVRGKSLLAEDPEAIERFIENWGQRLLNNLANMLAQRGEIESSEFRVIVHIADSYDINLRSICPDSIRQAECFNSEKWVTNGLFNENIFPFTESVLDYLESIGSKRVAPFLGPIGEQVEPSESLKGALAEFLRTKEMSALFRSYAFVSDLINRFQDEANQYWDSWVNSYTSVPAYVYASHGKNLSAIRCETYQTEIIEKKVELNTRIIVKLAEIDEVLRELMELDLTSSDGEMALNKLRILNDELLLIQIDSSSVNLVDGVTPDRVITVSSPFQLGSDLEFLIGERFQIEFMQIGDRYWVPQYALTLDQSLPSMQSMTSFGRPVTSFGLGRLGADATIQANIKVSPETACSDQIFRMIIYFPDYADQKYFLVQANLSKGF